MLFLHWFYKVVHEKCCFYIGFTRLSTKRVVFTLVLQGCPRKMLFLHWFYKVVREKYCFYIGFTRVVHENACKTCIKTTFFVDNPRKSNDFRTFLATGEEEQEELNCPHNSPSYSIESPLARPHSFASPRPLARTNETKRFPGWRFHKGLTPPTSNKTLRKWLAWLNQ